MVIVPYVPERIPPDTVKEMLESNWETMNGRVPMPQFIVVNQGQEAPALNLERHDYVFIAADTAGETERLRNAWEYKETKFDVILELATMENRQRLYDLKKIIRGIVHTNIHNSPDTGWQVWRYGGFQELNTEQYNIWRGMIRMSFEEAGVILDRM